MLPPYLNPGDKIAIVAPARKITPEELVFSLECIQKQGFVPVLGPNVYGQNNQYSGTDKERLHDLQWAIDDNEIKAVLAARGGYGCLRLVDQLDLSKLTKNPKWIIGYSDLTVVHSHLTKHIGIASLHATMPINFHKNKLATQSLFDAVKGDTLHYTFQSEFASKTKSVSGTIVGGNLSLLYAMQGSTSDVNTNDCILFIEDLDEYLYHIDRMILSLKRSGKLAHLKALLVGGFTDLKDNAVAFGKTAEEIILEHTAEYNYPVFFNFPAGHQDLNCAVKLGAEASIEVQHNGEVLFVQ